MGPEGLIARCLTDNNFALAAEPVDNRSVVRELSPGLWLDSCLCMGVTP